MEEGERKQVQTRENSMKKRRAKRSGTKSIADRPNTRKIPNVRRRR